MSSPGIAPQNVSSSGPPDTNPNPTSYQRMDLTKAQIDEVISIMNTNVDKVLLRDEMITELDAKATEVCKGAEMFQSKTSELSRKYWWKNNKMLIVIGLICVFMVIIICVYFFT
ncbi:vesicle-associated membrane protein 1 [Mixophyes fleayi]|uniref:vesicle-associated membrane protein 1 n=1 Tax=Mixophyes fleayi TaxID=3061075 RepID=UPI003F4DFF82